MCDTPVMRFFSIKNSSRITQDTAIFMLNEKEIQLLNSYKKQIYNLEEEKRLELITPDEADCVIAMTKAKEFKLKKKLVEKVHITDKGEPRKIEYKEYKDRWCTRLKGRVDITAKTEEALIDKLFEHYHLTLTDTSIKSVFEEALASRSVTDNYNHSTVTGYRSAFNRYILASLADKEIVQVTREDLGVHTQNVIQKYNASGKQMTKKQFLKYKGVLNLIFSYAMEKQIITENPVLLMRNQPFMKSLDTSKAKPQDKIFSPSEIEAIKKQVRLYMTYKRYPDGYYVNGYGILLAIETGMRVGELCSLKWSDIEGQYLHIQSQQVIESSDEKFVERKTTKNEKGESDNGRYFPITDNLAELLKEIKAKQEELGIHSPYILAKADGSPTKTTGYQTSLRRLCRSLDIAITKNHAFRMSFNSNVLIPAGIPETKRAEWLGQTVETNLGYYSYAERDENNDYLDILNRKLSE